MDSDKSFDVDSKHTYREVVRIVLNDPRFDTENPEVAEETAAVYLDHMEQGLPDDDESIDFAYDVAVRQLDRRNDMNDESSSTGAKPMTDVSGGNPVARDRSVSVAKSHGEDLEKKLMTDGGIVEGANKNIESVNETVDETNWSAVQAEIEGKLRERMWNDMNLRNDVKEILDEHGQYDYGDQGKTKFVNEIFNFVAEHESERIAHQIAFDMTSQEHEKQVDKSSTEESLRNAWDEIKKGSLKKVGSEAVKKVAEHVGPKGLIALASAIGGALAGFPVL